MASARHFLILPPLLALLALLPTQAPGTLMPGLSPNDFEQGEALNVFANKMVSRNNRLPYDYDTLPFCPPSPERIDALKLSKDSGRLGIGQILQGERSRLTAYEIEVMNPVKCRNICTAQFTKSEIDLLATRISKGYRVRLTLDDFPVVVRGARGDYMLGYPLGDSTASVNTIEVVNHLDFNVMYHVPDEYESLSSPTNYAKNKKVYRVVGFEVIASSIQRNECPSSGGEMPILSGPFVVPSKQEARIPTNISFSYSVKFTESSVRWATRYDTLMKISAGHKKMQAFAIVNSLMLALFLTASLAVVLVRNLRRDCMRYGISAGDIMDDFNEDFDNDVGWRMLRGDVFRPPVAGGMLCVLCGSGVQLVLVTIVTLAFALLGIVSPHRRGNLVSGLLVAWVLSSGCGGYVAARLQKAMGGVRWKLVTFGVAIVLPGIAFSTFFVVNIVVWMMGSTGAAPFVTMFLLLFLWLGVSVPLAFAGTYLGYKRKAYDFPVRTNQIPRPIPRQPKYLHSPSIHLIAGMLPFGVVCIELRLILNSIYLDEFYHFFGFLMAVFTILAITCAEVSVVVVFVKLSNCDYGWWWNSWFASGASGVYVLLYSIYYLLTSPGADPKNIVSNFLFIAYSTLGSLCFSLLTGTIGFLSSLAFVRRIYSDSVDD